MNYKDLNKTQKRVIDAFIKLRPELANASTITRPEVEELFFKLHAERANGGEKIGYPMWLVKGVKVARGSYVFPAPNVVNENIISAVAKRVALNTKEDEEFLNDLKEAGIEV
jgi:hypothetical protein